MRSIKCLFGYHDWGKQENVREKVLEDGAWMIFVPVLFFAMMFPPKICERTCLRCGKVKTFDYESLRGN